MDNDMAVVAAFIAMINLLKANKPGNRSDRDRGYAVTITKMEEAFGYFAMFVIKPDDLIELLTTRSEPEQP